MSSASTWWYVTPYLMHAGPPAADSRDGSGGGVRRVHQTVCGDGGLQVSVDDTRLDDRASCSNVDVENPIHACEIQHDSVVTRCDRRGKISRRATRDNVYAMVVREGEQRCDVTAGGRTRDRDWHTAPGDEVGPRRRASGLVGHDRVGADEPTNIRYEPTP